ncbi:TRAP transporter substrate-binding protein [Desulfuromonas acetoxidans]|uniref:TRAP transporter substrate-binding protein n=1 Tax=Desulfuromonas acetoxidans TaxID=891 RepID=UPI00159394C1|nr:TRAP transporter substrate-binding protein [Desulfuromonas acetoxidans]MBF0645465.1 TRAP transporter substrate-binding protein [Desulfuromonas acetoxidans]NVD25334.1 TRAP transporter substrate-binding protein [Desulfuromonas acetoxidans]NVE17386.1 TRAP transporter substrate-binding protein [Desulfuromonas acetoxidans]
MKKSTATFWLISLFCLISATVQARDLSILEQWKPKFDPSGAQYTYMLSNVDHPAIAGIGVGYRIRDRVWEESGGRIYVDFRPLAQLGGEKDVVRKLKMGAIQGMLCSSVMAANVAPKLGIVNLPFIFDSSEKLEKFRNTPELFDEFSNAAVRSGIKVIDFTGYGSYGWATTTPVRTLEEAQKVNFRIAQAPVNKDNYLAWGLKFTVLPWPDVPQALQTGVIDGLDHTPIVCSITKKFDVATYFTDLHYTQGLYIHMVNKRWLDKLPEELKEIFLKVVREESAIARQKTDLQQAEQIEQAKKDGVQFFTLSDADRQTLKNKAQPVYNKWGKKIGADYLKKVQTTLD